MQKYKITIKYQIPNTHHLFLWIFKQFFQQFLLILQSKSTRQKSLATCKVGCWLFKQWIAIKSIAFRVFALYTLIIIRGCNLSHFQRHPRKTTCNQLQLTHPMYIYKIKLHPYATFNSCASHLKPFFISTWSDLSIS